MQLKNSAAALFVLTSYLLLSSNSEDTSSVLFCPDESLDVSEGGCSFKPWSASCLKPIVLEVESRSSYDVTINCVSNVKEEFFANAQPNKRLTLFVCIGHLLRARESHSGRLISERKVAKGIHGSSLWLLESCHGSPLPKVFTYSAHWKGVGSLHIKRGNSAWHELTDLQSEFLKEDHNIYATADVTLDQAYTGQHVLEISYTRRATCQQCGGLGNLNRHRCPYCSGNGFHDYVTVSDGIKTQKRVACHACHGRGIIQSPHDVCPTCRGEGFITKLEHLSFTVPSGIDEGNEITVPNMGHVHIPTLLLRQRTDLSSGTFPTEIEVGDFFLQYHILPHPVFTRNSTDLRTTLNISLSEAVHGFVRELGLLDGTSVRVVRHERTAPGTVFRVHGRGMPHLEASLPIEDIDIDILHEHVHVHTDIVHDNVHVDADILHEHAHVRRKMGDLYLEVHLELPRDNGMLGFMTKMFEASTSLNDASPIEVDTDE